MFPPSIAAKITVSQFLKTHFRICISQQSFVQFWPFTTVKDLPNIMIFKNMPHTNKMLEEFCKISQNLVTLVSIIQKVFSSLKAAT